MIAPEKRRLYLFSGSTLVIALALAIGLALFSPAGRARRIAARNAAARGGLGAWRAVKTLSMFGRLDAGVRRDPIKLALAYQSQIRQRGQARRALSQEGARAAKPVQLPFELDLARPRKSRLEVRFQGQTAVQVFDGTRGWKLRPFLGRREVEPYDAEELRAAALQADLDGPLIDASAKGNRLRLVGSDKVDGHDAWNIEVTTPGGQVRHVWVDQQSSLELKIDGTRRLDGKPRPVWTYFRDYKRVDGLLIPHLLETVVEGVAGSEKIVIERVAVNPPLAAARFEKPEPVAASTRAGPAPLDAPKPPPPDGAEAPGTLARATRSTADYQIPKVSLLRDDGTPVSFPAELDDGRVVVLDFIFTSCATICPVMSQVFARLQDQLGADRDQVHLVSISIDPEEDRPARLAEYAKKLHAGPEWRHYTGTTEASVAVQRAFDAFRGDKMDHTPVTFLRAAPGRRWVRIDGFASAEELAREVRALLARR